MEENNEVKEKLQKCKICKKELPLEDFYVAKNGRIYKTCKICSDKRKMYNLCVVCKTFGLQRRASYGVLKDGKLIHCSDHKTDNEIDLVNKDKGCIVCQEQGLPFKIACFGLENGKKIHCSNHKTDIEIDLAHKDTGCITCEEQGLPFKRASFGLENGKMIHCSKHKSENEIDLASKNRGCIVCQEQGVFKQACFGLSQDGKKIHCAQHKTDNEIDLAHKDRGCIICQEQGVFKIATFGLSENGKKIHCSEHKADNEIALVNKNQGCIVCQEQDLPFKQACFGLSQDGKKIHCSNHKTDNEIDLANKNQGCIVCQEQGLPFKRASFGPYFEKKIHCAVHKLNNEFSKNNPKCSFKNCKKRPTYTDEKTGDTPERCEIHKKDTDVDIISRKCDTCGDDHFIPSNSTKCFGCRGFIAKKSNNRGVKEGKVKTLLLTLSEKIGFFTNDIKIQEGCSAKRPDFYYRDFNPFFSLIVECDENQHSKYSCGLIGELRRMVNLFEEGNTGHPIIFVRFNPDSYYSKNNKVITEYKSREDTLRKTILGLKNRDIFENKIGVIYLYYDNFQDIELRDFTHKVKDGNLIIDHKHPLSAETRFVIPLK